MITRNDLWITALTIFGEARGEPHEGQIAVGHVVRNRALQLLRRVPGLTEPYATVCRQPWQFRCWNAANPNLGLLMTLSLEQSTFAACLRVTLDVLSGAVPSNVGQSTHYVRADLHQWPPWAQGKHPLVQKGQHLFFEGIPW